MNKDITVYTAIFGPGNYRVYTPSFKTPQANYLCFTDKSNLDSNGFEVIRVKPAIPNDPDRSSKYLRMFPEKYLTTSYNIWFDAPMRLHCDVQKLIDTFLSEDKPMALYKNYELHSIREEAEYLMRNKNIDKNLLAKQISKYRGDGFKDTVGLYKTGFMLRKTFDSSLMAFNQLWWKELLKYSVRIEMSFPYLAWKTNLTFNLLSPGTVYNSPYYDYIRRVQHEQLRIVGKTS